MLYRFKYSIGYAVIPLDPREFSSISNDVDGLYNYAAEVLANGIEQKLFSPVQGVDVIFYGVDPVEPAIVTVPESHPNADDQPGPSSIPTRTPLQILHPNTNAAKQQGKKQKINELAAMANHALDDEEEDYDDPEAIDDEEEVEQNEEENLDKENQDPNMLQYWKQTEPSGKTVLEIFIRLLYETNLNAQLKNKSTRKLSVYRKAALFLAEKGFPVPVKDPKNPKEAGKKCQKKNLSLISAYKTYIEGVVFKTGAAAKSRPPYFDIMHPYLSKQPDILPQSVFDSFDGFIKNVVTGEKRSSDTAGPSRHTAVNKKLKPTPKASAAQDFINYCESADEQDRALKRQELALKEKEVLQRDKVLDILGKLVSGDSSSSKK